MGIEGKNVSKFIITCLLMYSLWGFIKNSAYDFFFRRTPAKVWSNLNLSEHAIVLGFIATTLNKYLLPECDYCITYSANLSSPVKIIAWVLIILIHNGVQI